MSSNSISTNFVVLIKICLFNKNIDIHLDNHSVKSVQIRGFFWSVFSCIRTEFEDIRSKSSYSVQIHENTDQKKLFIWTLFTQWMFLYFKINWRMILHQKFSSAHINPSSARIRRFLSSLPVNKFPDKVTP